MLYDNKKFLNLAFYESVDIANKYRIENLPKKIYKFIPLYNDTEHGLNTKNTRNLDTIDQNYIWASKSDSLNDPFEGKCYVLNENKILKSGNSIETFETLAEDFRNSFLILAFSAESEFLHPIQNLPMWAYYANNHQGICLEYIVENNSSLYQVCYEPDNSRYPLASTLSSFYEPYFNPEKLTSPHLDNDREKVMLGMLGTLLTKSKLWQNENEYRILHSYNCIEKNGKKLKLSDVHIKLNAIYMGNNCTDTINISRLQEIAQKHNIELSKMIIDEKNPKFEMVVKSIT